VTARSYACEWAWLGQPSGVAADVAIDVVDGRFTRVEPGGAVPPGAERLGGLVLPGLANAHSHAFHRALRGRTHSAGTFWTWREQMYRVAERLEPDTYLALARATFAEAVLAGCATMGEFHYLHHQVGGTPYADANPFGHALVHAAREAGARLTLLDACYLTGGIGQPLAGVQRRFGDHDAQRWAVRVDDLASTYADASDVVVGAAIHSVRAVPRDQMGTVVGWAAQRRAPLHVHVSEQPAENAACVGAYGVTPTVLLGQAGALGPSTTAVHATHLADADVRLLGQTGTHVCACPTTERDLADGVGPARALCDAGAPLTLGSDSHAVTDLFEEARAVELDLRLRTRQRGQFTPAQLLHALTVSGHASLGFPDAGALASGQRADLVAVRMDSVRTAGTPPDAVVFAASAADVTDVVIDGRHVVREGRHMLGDLARLQAEAIAAVVTDLK
jgi:formiminoglutamate deiminase